MLHNQRQLRVASSEDSLQPGLTSPRYNSQSRVYIPGSFGVMRSGEHSPWNYGGQFTEINEWYRAQTHSTDRLFMSVNFRSPSLSTDGNQQKSSTDMPTPLPKWIWTILASTLGIGNKASKKEYLISTMLHVLTLLSAFLFGASGLFFNAYDTASEFTKTTVLVCVAKSGLGLYWIGLGIYANVLAIRLFSNQRMVDCIRLHSKTFLKMSTAFVVMLLSVSVVIVNLYSNQYLLEGMKSANATSVIDANCASIGIDPILCRFYFGSKVVYSCFCLMWNLLVVGVFLSVCRTHTITIRRFMEKLLYDTRIYVEFSRIQALEKQAEYVQSLSEEPIQQEHLEDLNSFSDTNIWDDDIVGFDLNNASDPPSNAELLQSLLIMRIRTSDQLANDIAASIQDQFNSVNARGRSDSFAPWLDEEESEESSEEVMKETVPDSLHPSEETTTKKTPSSDRTDDVQEEPVGFAEYPMKPVSSANEGNENRQKLRDPDYQARISYKKESVKTLLSDLSPPLMTNEELLFTYFQLLRRLSSTSRLLQRWISNWITFVMLWCALLVVYWTSHTAQLSGISQFLIPLVTLGFLTSGYAEVNFEGERLIKCVLPIDDRMPVIYYFQNSKLELKIFSFTMTYNTIVTVVAGIALTFATRIILDQFNLSKGHPA